MGGTSSEPKPEAAAAEESSNQSSGPESAAAASEKSINQPAVVNDQAWPPGAVPQTRLKTSGSQDKPLRILCMHGHNSNSDITEIQIAALRLSKHASCSTLHGLWQGSAGSGLANFSDGPWYTWAGRKSMGLQWDLESWEASQRYLIEYVQQHGPFDGVYAFSQGVALTTTVCAPEVWRDKFGLENCPFRFAILACGGAGGLVSVPMEGEGIGIPSLHIKGGADWCLADSTKLENHWNEAQRKSFTHPGGHEITLGLLTKQPELALLLDRFLDQVSTPHR